MARHGVDRYVPKVMSWWRGDLDGPGQRVGLDPALHRLLSG